MGAQVEGIFRVGIAPLPASALMVSFSPRASTSPSAAHLAPKYSMCPQILSLQELLPLCYGFHPSPKRGGSPCGNQSSRGLFSSRFGFPPNCKQPKFPRSQTDASSRRKPSLLLNLDRFSRSFHSPCLRAQFSEDHCLLWMLELCASTFLSHLHRQISLPKSNHSPVWAADRQ